MKQGLRPKQVFLYVLTLTSLSAWAEPQGDTSVFQSPRGLTEKCIALTKLPGAVYSKKDAEKESEFCDINFYDNSVALCAKTWSTSPGTIIYDNSKTGRNSVDTERAKCQSRENGLDIITKFKQTMNRAATSGTFSQSSLLYYHFSRLLNSTVTVPVAVFRTIDKDEHYSRVSRHANPSVAARMNRAGWDVLKQAELTPKSYGTFAIDLFTEDFKQIKGVLVKGSGERYGAEVNGTRANGWGNGQNYDFQKTPAFLALQSPAPIQQAMHDGAMLALRDHGMARALELDRVSKLGRPSDLQMAMWMKEISEITILDYILDQQDRIGNIDYQWYWIYQDASGKVSSKKAYSKLPRSLMNKIAVPAELAAFNPELIQKTSLNDNDAGGMMRYVNYTKNTGMLDGGGPRPHAPIRHLNIETYRRMLAWAKDFREQGPNYQTVLKSFDVNYNRFNSDRMKFIGKNIQEVAEIFRRNCEKKVLRFDIPDLAHAYAGDFSETTVEDCTNP